MTPPNPHPIDRRARERLNGHPGRLVWLTGLSGAGKSTLATLVEQRLNALGLRSYVLDGDDLRQGLNRDLGFSPDDRVENIRRVGEVGRLMVDAGIVVLAAFISPYRADRAIVRERVGSEDFIEVFVDAPLEVCEQRDPKGLYARARRGQLPLFTGVSAPYEAPLSPDLRVDTSTRSPDRAADEVLSVLLERLGIRASTSGTDATPERTPTPDE